MMSTFLNIKPISSHTFDFPTSAFSVRSPYHNACLFELTSHLEAG